MKIVVCGCGYRQLFEGEQTISCPRCLGANQKTYFDAPEVPGYHIHKLLGMGGVGIVYQAVELSSGRQVAIKILKSRDQSIMRERFVREARAVARIEHPNIMRIYSFGIVDDEPFVVMEYLEGCDLAALVRKDGPLPWRTACDYIAQASEGLMAYHRHGLVHRDVKPSNLFLCSTGKVVLFDFELGRAARGHELPFEMAGPEASGPHDPEWEATRKRFTATGEILGTPAFMPPEQYVSAAVTTSADIYSLGASLYYLLTGRAPFRANSFSEYALKVQSEDPVPVASSHPGTPRSIEKTIRKMMAKNPADRFANADSVSVHLRALLSPSRWQRIFSRRS
jgi:serine/threonine-protein kinase